MSITNLKNSKILTVISIAFLAALTLMTIFPLANAELQVRGLSFSAGDWRRRSPLNRGRWSPRLEH